MNKKELMTYAQTLFEGRDEVLFWVEWLVE